MGLFSKKVKVDLDQTFKDTYKEINRIIGDAHQERDITIKISLLQLANTKYEELLSLIDHGANFERPHFESLKQSLEKELEIEKELNNEN